MILHEFDELGSTNDMVRQLLENGNTPPFWVIANRQTAGRGRRGKVWHSIAGNLMASGAYSFEKNSKAISLLSFVVAIALKRCFEKYIDISRISLKWPNDIYIDGKKISGILLEHFILSNKSNVIVGIGINLIHKPENLDQEIISLSKAMGINYPCPSNKAFLQEFISQFDIILKEYLFNGFANIRKEWLNHAYKLGSRVKANIGTSELYGIFETINENGDLVLLDEFNNIYLINSGDVFFQH